MNELFAGWILAVIFLGCAAVIGIPYCLWRAAVKAYKHRQLMKVLNTHFRV